MTRSRDSVTHHPSACSAGWVSGIPGNNHKRPPQACAGPSGGLGGPAFLGGGGGGGAVCQPSSLTTTGDAHGSGHGVKRPELWPRRTSEPTQLWDHQTVSSWTQAKFWERGPTARSLYPAIH